MDVLPKTQFESAKKAAHALSRAAGKMRVFLNIHLLIPRQRVKRLRRRALISMGIML